MKWRPFKKTFRKVGRAVRQFLAAKVGRLTADWVTTITSSDDEIRWSLTALRARSRGLYNNNEYAKRYVKLLEKNIVGPDGVRMKSDVRDPVPDEPPDRGAQKAIEAAWIQWGRKGIPTMDGQLSWIGLQKLTVNTAARDGELLLQHVRGNKAENDFGYALRVIEADRLDDSLMRAPTGDNVRIVMGVEKNGDGRPIAYHLWTEHPQDMMANRGQRVRVPAAEIMHLFDQYRPSQTRGVPWAHSAMMALKQAGEYRISEAVASRVAAAKMGAIETNADAAPPPEWVGDDVIPDGDEQVGAEGRMGAPISEVDPGTIHYLAPGQKLTTWDPQHPSTAFGDFMSTVLRGSASGLDMDYVALSNDLVGVSFATGRLAALDVRDTYRCIQRWLIESLCQPVFDSWLEMALTTGTILLPTGKPLPFRDLEKFRRVKWWARGWQWVDPAKEATSVSTQIDNATTSRSRVLADKGIDFDDMLEEIQEENAKLASAGIKTEAETPSTVNLGDVIQEDGG